MLNSMFRIVNSAMTSTFDTISSWRYSSLDWIDTKLDDIRRVFSQENEPSEAQTPLINRVGDVGVDPGKITLGHGEYIVFHMDPNGQRREVDRETFEKVYEVLNYYSPGEIIDRDSKDRVAQCANRYELAKSEVKKINPTLEIVFIPSTLVELVFIRKCIKEDLKHGKICPLLDRDVHTPSDEQQRQKLEKLKSERKKCWHPTFFRDAGDSRHPGVKDIAYRLNHTMVKTFSPTSEGLTHQEFSALAEKEISFLKDHYKKYSADLKRKKAGENIYLPFKTGPDAGPTVNFGIDFFGGSIGPMPVWDESTAQIIRDVVKLDCSKLAQESYLFYRGAQIEKDTGFYFLDPKEPYCLSLGTSLFACCAFDGPATAFHYTRGTNNTYAVSVPYDQLKGSIFHIRTARTNTYAQLLTGGELCHVRTKAPRGHNVNKKYFRGIYAAAYDLPESLNSNLSMGQIKGQLGMYKAASIRLDK